MKITFLFLALYCSSFASWAAEEFASNCDPIDFRPTLGVPLDQGDTGYCFAHTSADLVSQAVGFRVSAFDLAQHYILGNLEALKGVRHPDLLRFLDETPFFAERWRNGRNDEPQNFSTGKILTKFGLFFTGGDEFETIFAANLFGLCLEDRLPSGAKNFESYLKEIRSFHRERLRSGDWDSREGEESIGEVLEPMARVAARSFVRWIDHRCKDRVFFQRAILPRTERYANDFREFSQKVLRGELDAERVRDKLFQTVDANLKMGKVTAIGFSADELMVPDPKVPGGDHSAVIAARMRKKNQCWYFLRNSFGDSAKDYQPKFLKRFENGGVWILKEELRTLYSAVWVE